MVEVWDTPFKRVPFRKEIASLGYEQWADDSLTHTKVPIDFPSSHPQVFAVGITVQPRCWRSLVLLFTPKAYWTSHPLGWVWPSHEPKSQLLSVNTVPARPSVFLSLSTCPLLGSLACSAIHAYLYFKEGMNPQYTIVQ
jgi:hypothetical protein